MSITHSLSNGLALGPDSPPTITQSMSCKLRRGRDSSRGSRERNLTRAPTWRRCSIRKVQDRVSTLTPIHTLSGQSMLAFSTDGSYQKTPVLKTVATTGEGIQDLFKTLFEFLKSNERDTVRQEEQIREEISALLEKEIAYALHQKWSQDGDFDVAVKQVLARERDPYSLVQEIIEPLIRVCIICNLVSDSHTISKVVEINYIVMNMET